MNQLAFQIKLYNKATLGSYGYSVSELHNHSAIPQEDTMHRRTVYPTHIQLFTSFWVYCSVNLFPSGALREVRDDHTTLMAQLSTACFYVTKLNYKRLDFKWQLFHSEAFLVSTNQTGWIYWIPFNMMRQCHRTVAFTLWFSELLVNKAVSTQNGNWYYFNFTEPHKVSRSKAETIGY